MRPNWDDYFMRYAYLAATRATCPRRHVGGVIVDPEHRVVATGYNGAPPGVPSCDEIGCQMVDNHCVRTLHAESNALDYAGTRLAHNGTLYVTITPCWDCAKRIIGAKIMRVVYDEHYESRYGKSMDVPDFLREHGVEVERFEEGRMAKFKQLLTLLDTPTDLAAMSLPGSTAVAPESCAIHRFANRVRTAQSVAPESCAIHRFANDVCVVCGTNDRD